MESQHKSAMHHQILKSENDNKSYRDLVLKNKLKVLLSSDPTTEKAGVSMSVAVGSMNDPPEIPGLAHLCEHMLFHRTGATTGSGSGYSKFISENGGSCNAFTTRDQTNYHFDVAVSGFVEALTRFANFFTTTPEFSNVALEQELKAINSEHENKLANEAWRKMAIESCTAKPGHPFRHFSTGNLETLSHNPKSEGIDVLEFLKNFHSQFYSASIMSLVILSREDLNTLEALVVNLFSCVKNLDIVIPTWPENPYGPDECQQRIDIVPLSDVRDLYVCFPMPDSRPWFKTFPHGYLSNLLGHKGKGSLFSLLSCKKWVNNTYINSTVPARGFGYFTVGLQLTVEGLNHVEEIVEIVFKYIDVLKREGPQKYFWEELQCILRIQFQFIDQENPIDFVQRISNLIHVYPFSDVLRVGYILDNFDKVVIKKFTDHLNPESCRIMLISKDNAKVDTQTEQWYGVKYRVNRIDPTLIEKWKCLKMSNEMHLPLKNCFIPSKFGLKYTPQPNMKNVPKRICKEAEIFKAWFYQDYELFAPKVFIRLELFSFLPMVNPLMFTYHHIMALMFKDSLAESLYSAILAGLNYTIKGTMYGIEITFDGYDEKIGVLVKTILESLMEFKDLNGQFYQAKKDSYENGLVNASNQQPYNQVPYYFALLMREKRFSNEELVVALADLNEEWISEYHKQFMKNLNVECLIYGNMSEDESIDYIQKWNKMFRDFGTLPLLPNQSYRLCEIQLPLGTSWVYKKMLNNKNQPSCCAVLFPVPRKSSQDNVIIELLDQIIYEPCFNQLRNREQLGYIVRSSVRKSNGTHGLLVVVQGAFNPELVHKRIEAFLRNFEKCLQRMSSETFCHHKNSVALRKTDVQKKLLLRANRLWNNEIYTREYNFSRNRDDLAFLQTVNLSEIISFYNKYINPSSLERKCIAVHLQSTSSTDNIANNVENKPLLDGRNYNEITNILDWKSNMTLSVSPLFSES